jgi:RNA polymerase sigma factor (sigma-70 family)
MSRAVSPLAARQLGSLFESGTAAGLSDGQLIERFTALAGPAGEAAFATIVARHGPMVLVVCRQLLGDHHHAEDAFQAVFLVLARQARSIRDPELLESWLHGVALRTARKARARLARRRQTEDEGKVMRPAATPATAAEEVLMEREQAVALHGEIGRLPVSFRTPVLLCYFEGLTLDEAAAKLKWPPGTLRSRLARARLKLRRGLVRRGVALPAAVLGAMLESRPAIASVPPLLCDSTTRAAVEFVARQAGGGRALSASAGALAQEVIASMVWHKLRFSILSVFTFVALASSAGYLALSLNAFAQRSEVERAGAGPSNPARASLGAGGQALSAERPQVGAAAPAGARPPDSTGRMFVVGRVLGPHGKPVPNAHVMVYGAPKGGGALARRRLGAPAALGQAECDGSSQFRLEMPRISSATHYLVSAVALAPGYGAGWVSLEIDTAEPKADVTLRPEQPIQGHLFEVNGVPADKVCVTVEGIGHPRHGPESVPDVIEGPYFLGGSAAAVPAAWPQPVFTGNDGRFTIRGIGQGLRAVLLAESPRFARQRLVVDTDATGEPKLITAVMEPPKIITGRVTFADTGQAVPHAEVSVWAYRGGRAYISDHQTDADGKFRANPFSTDNYNVNVVPPEGGSYLGAGTGIFEWTKGTFERRIDLALRRGAVIRGKVVEEGSGRPVAGAALGYKIRDNSGGMPACRVHCGPDGSYQLAVLPEPGTLAVIAPSDDYVLQVTSMQMIDEGRGGGSRLYAHAFIPCELKPETKTHEVNVVLRRGATVAARVTVPDGRPIGEAWALSRLLLQPSNLAARRYWGGFHAGVRNGHFELHGLPRDTEVPVYFLDAKNQLGATAMFSANAAKSGPIDVRLEPCGSAVARLVDRTGKPVAAYNDPYLVAMIVTPGPDRQSKAAAEQDGLTADQDYLSRIDPMHHADRVTDALGRITFPALIPGATYRVFDETAQKPDRQVRAEFVAKSGETIVLGDILIEKPEP